MVYTVPAKECALFRAGPCRGAAGGIQPSEQGSSLKVVIWLTSCVTMPSL